MPNSPDTFISKFEPISHFFTNPALITQASNQAYGPVSENEFRLTTKFTASAGAKAFAICQGIVLVQPQKDQPTKVNLVIRPYKQPIQGINIKYFVYRGLNKSDFFTADQKIIPTSAGTTSDFITDMNEAFTSFHSDENPLPDFLAKYIGYNEAITDTTISLDDFFFKVSETTEVNGEQVEAEDTAFELPLVKMGKTLGNFATGECGIDVVLSYGDYIAPTNSGEFVFDLAYARAAESVINLTGLTDAVQKKRKREHITQFIDIVAYFGFHHSEKGYVLVDNAGTKEKKTTDAIYSDVLSAFTTKNSVYLYIQGDRTRSYNFYGNYVDGVNSTNCIKTGITDTTLTAKNFETSSWPLLIDTTAQTHDGTRNNLFIQLVTDGNASTMLYGEVAQIDNATQNNFSNAETLVAYDTDGITPLKYTHSIALSYSAYDDSGSKKNVANFMVLIYQGMNYSYLAGQEPDENGTPQGVFAQPNFFDDVFDLVNAEPIVKGGTGSFSIRTSQRKKLINNIIKGKQEGISAVQTIVVNDSIETGDESNPILNRVLYVTELINILSVAVTLDNKMNDTSTTSCATIISTSNKTYELPPPFIFTLKPFTEGLTPITGIILKTSDSSIPNKVFLGVSKDENESIITVINESNLNNPRIFLIDLFQEDTQLISKENILYKKYSIGIVGEQQNDGKLTLLTPETPIYAYSLDGLYHFSNNYSKYVFIGADDVLYLDLDLIIE